MSVDYLSLNFDCHWSQVFTVVTEELYSKIIAGFNGENIQVFILFSFWFSLQFLE